MGNQVSTSPGTAGGATLMGSVMLVAGSTIGAGMLALPASTAQLGFGLSIFEMVVFFLIMLVPAYALLELCQAAPIGTSLAGLARMKLGPVGAAVVNIAFYILVFSLFCAYLAGTATNVLAPFDLEHMAYGEWIEAGTIILMAIAFGVVLVYSFKIADYVNRVFFWVMVVAFFVMAALAIPHLGTANLLAGPEKEHLWFNVAKSFPFFAPAFGFHLIIPSLYEYNNGNVKVVRSSIFLGLLIPLSAYIIWLLVVDGILPADVLSNPKVNIAEAILQVTQSSAISVAASLFAIGALVTSFIGVGMAMVTTLHEQFADKQTTAHSGQVGEEGVVKTRLTPFTTFLLAFVLPTVLVLFYPKGFLFFLILATVFFTLSSLFVPQLVAVMVRCQNADLFKSHNWYRSRIPSWVIVAVIVFLLVISLFSLYNS